MDLQRRRRDNRFDHHTVTNMRPPCSLPGSKGGPESPWNDSPAAVRLHRAVFCCFAGYIYTFFVDVHRRFAAKPSAAAEGGKTFFPPFSLHAGSPAIRRLRNRFPLQCVSGELTELQGKYDCANRRNGYARCGHNFYYCHK